MTNTKSKTTPEVSEETNPVFTGILMYAKLGVPDNYKGQEKWKVDLLLNAEELKRAKAMKLRVKREKKDGTASYADMFEGYDGSYLALTRNTKTFKGIKMDPPKILNEYRVSVDPMTYLIGNGTLAKVKTFVQREISKEDFVEFGGYKAYLSAVRILKLVPYGAAGSEGDPDFMEASPDSPGAPLKSSSKDFDWDKGDSPFDDDDSKQTIMSAG